MASVQSLQKNKTSESRLDTGTWSKMFPTRLDTEARSRKFLFKLLGISVSSLIYLRTAFPEHAYTDYNLDGLQLKVLNKTSGIPGVVKLCQKIENALEALKLKYLKTLTLGIFLDPAKPEDALETYTFQFEYKEDGVINMSLNSSSSSASLSGKKERNRLYRETCRILYQILQRTEKLPPLPEAAYMTLHLMYFDDRTPADYQPPGFGPTEITFKLHEEEEEEDEPFLTGSVQTPWHSLSASIRSRHLIDQELPNFSDEEEKEERTTPVMPSQEASTAEGECVEGLANKTDSLTLESQKEAKVKDKDILRKIIIGNNFFYF